MKMKAVPLEPRSLAPFPDPIRKRAEAMSARALRVAMATSISEYQPGSHKLTARLADYRGVADDQASTQVIVTSARAIVRVATWACVIFLSPLFIPK